MNSEQLREAVTAQVDLLSALERERAAAAGEDPRSCRVGPVGDGRLGVTVPTGFETWVEHLRERFGDAIVISEENHHARQLGASYDNPS